MAVESDSRILDANRRFHELQTVDHVGRAVLVPDPCGSADALRFAGDQRALPRRQGKDTRMAEAAEAGDAAAQLIRTLRQRQRVLDEATCLVREFCGVGGALLQLLPERDGIAKAACGEDAESRVVLGKNEGLAAIGDGIAVALFDGFGGCALGHAEMIAVDRQISTGSEANEIKRICARECFVEVVDSPDETPFGVAPGAEVFDVKIPDAEDGRSLRDFWTRLGPMLKPAIEGGAEEGEWILRHERVLER